MPRHTHYIIPLLFSPLLFLVSSGSRPQVAAPTTAVTTADVTRIYNLVAQDKQSSNADHAQVTQTIRALAEQQARDFVRLRSLEKSVQTGDTTHQEETTITPPGITPTLEQLADSQSMQQIVTLSLYRLRDHRLTALRLTEYTTTVQGILDKLLKLIDEQDVLRQSLHIAQRDREYNQRLLIKAQSNNWSVTREVLLYTLGFKWLWGLFTGYALSPATSTQSASLAAADQRVYQLTHEQDSRMVEITTRMHELLDQLSEQVHQVPMVALDPHWGINHTNLVYELIYRLPQLFPSASTAQLHAVFAPLLTDIHNTLTAIDHIEQQFTMYADYYNRIIKASHAHDPHVDIVTTTPDALWSGLPPSMPTYTLVEQEKITSDYNAAYANILETARAYATISNIMTDLRATQQLVGRIRQLVDQRSRVLTMVSTDLLSYLDAHHNNWSFGSEIMLYLFGFKWFWGIYTHWSPTTYTRSSYNQLYYQRSTAASTLAQLDQEYAGLLSQYQASHIRMLMRIREARRTLASDKFTARIRGIAFAYYTQHKSFLAANDRMATEHARLVRALMQVGEEASVGNTLITRGNTISDEESLRAYDHYLASVAQFNKMVDDVSLQLTNNYATVLSQSSADYAVASAHYRILGDLHNSNATDALMGMPPTFAQIYQDVINASPLLKPGAEISERVASRLISFFDRWLTPRTMAVQQQQQTLEEPAESSKETTDEKNPPVTSNVTSSSDTNTSEENVVSESNNASAAEKVADESVHSEVVE